MSETDGLSKITNRPGLSALSYRTGDYASFRNQLLAQLSQVLPNLKTRDPDDAAIALLDAWAVVSDVLTFYQERIANEGYLNTATERQSMIELARLIGYELKPGVSASTHLAFTIEDKPGGSPPVKILQGTQVMSIPGEGELPQIFETSEDILASPVWNALRPRLSKPQEITRNTRQLYLKGTSTRLEGGDWLLLTGIEDQREKTFLLALKTVQPIPILETTLISWDYDLEDLDPKTILRHPQIFAFRQRAGLFGNNAPRWDVAPDDLKRKSPGVQLKGGVFSALNPTESLTNKIKWTPNSVGLPNQDILCLATRKTFRFAGTEGSGIFRSDEADTSWQPINSGLTNLNVQALFVVDEERGYLLAGTPAGGVFRSKDNGETWTPIGVGSIRIERKDNGDIVNAINTGIPNVVVRSLLAYTTDQDSYIFVGTDDSIYRTKNQGEDWSSNKIPTLSGLLDETNYGKTYQSLPGLPDRVVSSLLYIPDITGEIASVDINSREITLRNSSGILEKGSLLIIQGRKYSVNASAKKATIQLLTPFLSDISGQEFQASNSVTGTISVVNGLQIDVFNLSGNLDNLKEGDNITVGEETQKIAQILSYTVEITEKVDAISVGSKFETGNLFAGTDKGIHWSRTNGDDWQEQTQSDSGNRLIDKIIYSLESYTANNQNFVLAGTSDGVWICAVNSSSLVWEQAEQPQPQPRSLDPGNTPETDHTLRNQSVRSLQILIGTNYAFAGTDQGVFRGTRSNENTWTWEQTQDNYAVKKITSIAISTDSSVQVFAGAKFSGFTEEPPSDEVTSSQNEQTEWPNFYIQNNQIDLDTLYPKILKDSWVVLLNQSQESQQKNLILPPYLPIKVEQVSSEQRQGFTLDAKVTRLIPSQSIKAPEKFNPRSTIVLAQSEALALAEISLTVPVQQDRVFQDPIWDNKIFLNQYVHGLEAKKTVIVSGKHIRAKVNAGGIFRSRNWKLLSPDFVTENIQELAFREADKQLFAVTKTGVWRSLDGGQHWQLINQGLEGTQVSSIAIYSKPIDASLSSQKTTLQGRSSSSKKPFSNLKVGDILTVSKQVRVIKKVGGINSQEPSNELELNAGFGIDLLPGKTGGKINRVFVGTDKGVYRLQENLDPPQWTTSTITTPKNLQNVQILLINPKDHSVVAGTQSNGVFILADDSEIWQPKPFMDKVNILTLAADSKTGNLFAGTEENGVFCLSYGQDNWQSISAQLPDFHILSLVVQPASSGSATLFVGTATRGVFRQPANSENKTWEPVNTNLPDLQILNLFLDSENNYLIAGTKGGGIFRLSLDSSKAQVWESIEVGLGNQVVQCLAIGPQNRLLAGTPTGIFQELQPANPIPEIYWEHSNQGLIYSNVQTLVSHRFGGILHLFAGTKAGVFRSLNQGQTWELMNQGLKNTDIQTLLPIEESLENGNQTILKIFAGTKEGLFYSTDQGKSWQNINLGRIRPNVQTLAIHKSYLLAGTLNTGVFRSLDNGNSWTGVGLTKQDIRVLLSQGSNVLVGTASNGIWRSTNNGDTWEHWTDTRPGSGTISSNGVTVTGSSTKFSSELQSGDKIEADGQIRTVVNIVSNEKLIVDVAFKPALQSKPQSKGFVVYTGLDNLYITALAEFDGVIVAGTAGSGIFHTRNGQRWKKTGLQNLEIRCLKVGRVDQPLEYLYAGTATIGVFRLKTIEQESDRNEWESISARLTNTDVRAILIEESNLYVGGIGTLSSLDGVDFVELQPDDLLRVVAAPTETELPNGQTTIDAKEWQVLDRDNFKGKLTIIQSDDIQLYSATEDDPVVSEIAVIQSPPDDEDRPVVTLEKPLQQSYDPATVKVYANVVEATHGETVSEILGSGSGAATNQRFALSKPPLTHIAATDTTGSKSELKVYVNDVRWTEVPSLYPLDKQDRSYILRIEDDGTTTITFGDGQRGARLPSGRENITATYRSGIGLAGNVGAERIALKKTGPPSIQGVTNPLPATGAASSESLKSARSTIPATTRTLDRIVSRRDFEDFTQAFAGIGKAQAVTLWNGTSELVYITIASVGGEAVLPDSALYRNLVAAIDQARDPIQTVQIASFQPLFFQIEARVMHQDGYQADKVELAIRQKLLETFAFERRSFGQPVTKSEVIAAIQATQGVLAVDLDFLYRQDASRTLQPSLPTVTAFWDAKTNQVQPSQLLRLRSSSIKLTVGEML